MQKRGYARTIQGTEGAIYKLPTGTYVVRESNATIDAALNAAVDAANETGKNSASL